MTRTAWLATLLASAAMGACGGSDDARAESVNEFETPYS